MPGGRDTPHPEPNENVTKKDGVGPNQGFAVPRLVQTSLNGGFTPGARADTGLQARNSCLLNTDWVGDGKGKATAVRALTSPQGPGSPCSQQRRTLNTCAAPPDPGASSPVGHCLSMLRARQKTRAENRWEPVLGPPGCPSLVSPSASLHLKAEAANGKPGPLALVWNPGSSLAYLSFTLIG